MNVERYIVDTTLRDGEQMAGKIFSKDKKIWIAKHLDDLGVYQIEAGIPAMGSIEKECIQEILDNKKNSLISTWNRLNKSDIENSFDCKPDLIHISVPVSDIQIYNNLKKDKEWIVDNLMECVYYAQSKGYDVTIGLEDASRADLYYLISLCNILKRLNIKRVRYSDTVGILTPLLVRENITKIINETGMDIEMHVHNDFGMAVAISVEGIKCGAKYVDCTINGIGERAGNCNMKDFIRITNSLYKNMNG